MNADFKIVGVRWSLLEYFWKSVGNNGVTDLARIALNIFYVNG